MSNRKESRGARLFRRIALGVVASLLLAELAARVATNSLLRWGSRDDRDRYGMTDPVVGRVPRPGLSVQHPKGFVITTGEHGTRTNGSAPPRSERPLTLAVGDSFAFGDEVDDQDSWPAVLERLGG